MASYFNRQFDQTYSDSENDIGSEIEITDDEEDSTPKSISVDTRDIYDKDITANFRRLLNVKSLQRIINTIENKLRRKLRNHERQSVRQMIREEIDPSYNYRRDPTNRFYLGNLQNWNDKVIIGKVADKWVARQRAFNARGCAPVMEDMHEILKKEIGVTSESGTVSRPTFVEPITEGFVTDPVGYGPGTNYVTIDRIFGAATKYQLQKLFNPAALNGTNYIYLNSKFRNVTATDGINRFLWNENNQGNAGNGNFAYIGTVRDVIEFKVFPFRIPYPSDGSADNGFKKITLLFEEFNNQSFVDVGRRFHIVFQVTIDAGYINLSPFRSDEGRYKFEKPLTSINQLTVSFGSPTTLINFDPDRLPCTFVYGAITTIVFTTDHNLTVGDTISFVNFTTADPAGDLAVINEMNQADGHIISNVVPLTFTIAVDTTTITPIVGLTITCIFDSLTYQIPLKCVFVRPETTDSG